MGKLFQSSFNIATMLENSLCMIRSLGMMLFLMCMFALAMILSFVRIRNRRTKTYGVKIEECFV